MCTAMTSANRAERERREAQNSTTAIQRLLYSTSLSFSLWRNDAPRVDHRGASSDGRSGRRAQHGTSCEFKKKGTIILRIFFQDTTYSFIAHETFFLVIK